MLPEYVTHILSFFPPSLNRRQPLHIPRWRTWSSLNHSKFHTFAEAKCSFDVHELHVRPIVVTNGHQVRINYYHWSQSVPLGLMQVTDDKATSKFGQSTCPRPCGHVVIINIRVVHGYEGSIEPRVVKRRGAGIQQSIIFLSLVSVLDIFSADS